MHGMNPDHDGPPDPDDCGDAWRSPDALMPFFDGTGLTPQAPVAREQMSMLLRTVETQIIPRLMLLHRIGPQRSSSPAKTGPSLGERQVNEFTALVLKDQDAACSFVEGLLLRGVALPAVYLDLLAPAARRLGELWSADLCDFTDVTVGLGRLQCVLRDLSADARAPHGEGVPSQRALLLPVPGEQHTFGLSMVKEFFRQAGWLVWHELPDNPQRVLALVREHWFDLVGVSIGAERHVDGLTTLIRDLRKRSHNRALLVLVGGPLLLDHPELATRVGADASATDARQAMLQAERLMASR
jgi:MerR family transcriptional regulator, light-induced transcriptional regulator